MDTLAHAPRTRRAEAGRACDIDRLIDDRPDDGVFRVHRDTLVDEAIFELEMTHIFEATWVFLGHESQVARPHDFLSTAIGRRPVLVMRDGDGRLGAYHNSCRHRGALVCQRREGNRKSHVCPYHGWTYDSGGRNVNITNLADGAYPPAFRADDKNLLPVARFDSYRGMMFGSLNADVAELADHLGPARAFIDLICDQSPDGFELVPGRVTYTYDANWKWQIENLMDSYHFPVAHTTYLGVLQRQVGRERKAAGAGAAQEAGISSYANMKNQRRNMGRGCFDLGNGHSAMWGHTPNPEGRPLHLAREAVMARVGSPRGEWMFRTRNLNVYPNLQIHDNIASMIAIVRPLSAGRTEMVTWCIGPKGESAEGRRRRIRHCEEFLNFGIANPDDLACYEACQAGFADHPDMWLEYARGMTLLNTGRSADAAELGIDPKLWMYGPFDVGDETGHHHSWRQWARLLKAGLAGEGRA